MTLTHETPSRVRPGSPFEGPAEIWTSDIGPATASIMQRIGELPEPPEPQSDEALAAVDRVVLAIDVDRVSAANYIRASA